MCHAFDPCIILQEMRFHHIPPVSCHGRTHGGPPRCHGAVLGANSGVDGIWTHVLPIAGRVSLVLCDPRLSLFPAALLPLVFKVETQKGKRGPLPAAMAQLTL